MSLSNNLESAFAGVPDSTAKTAVVAAFDDVLEALDNASEDGAFSDSVAAQMHDEVIDVAERVATNMAGHVDPEPTTTEEPTTTSAEEPTTTTLEPTTTEALEPTTTGD